MCDFCGDILRPLHIDATSYPTDHRAFSRAALIDSFIARSG
jgi:hypothetical protein